MSSDAVALLPPVEACEPPQFSLFELVQAVTEVTDDDREVIATLRDLLGSGRARLRGGFRRGSNHRFRAGWYPG